MFLKGYPLEAKTAPNNCNTSVHISWARLTSFCHLGVISEPLIVSNVHNETNDPKGQEKKIYTIVSQLVDNPPFIIIRTSINVTASSIDIGLQMTILHFFEIQ